ncbi:hypothetical protein IGI04_043026 [Brassica rapa subsp. trilocularis]|uniref:Uncharacterized protein n=1 Tax=Brassica rapa subsp. trilocularis TaxID=1813537 RepID=A0ABQ7KKH2_BRACM|nr:hypothetical protein IGI04_043026 [Brassica rapa subsp. trilocularis]
MSVAVRVCPCVSVSTHRTSVAVHQHPHDVRGCLWLSISTHISTLVLGLSTLTLPLDCLGDFGPLRLSVQYTQDVSVCPSAHTGRPWLFVCVRQDTIDVCGCPSVHISERCFLGPQNDDTSRGLFGTFVAVCGCPSEHTGRPCVSVSTHRTSVAVHQYTYQHVGPWTPHADPSRGHFGPPWAASLCSVSPTIDICWLSISTHIRNVFLGLSTLTLSVGLLGDLGPRGAVRGVCMVVSVSTHRTSVAVHQYTYQHVGPWIQHADPSHGLFGTLTLPVDSSGEFGSRGLSVKYTQDVCGCQPAHKGRSWLSVSTHRTSVAVRVCPCVSVSTHRTSMAVHQYTYQHVVPWTQLADPSRGLFRTSMGVQDVSVCLSAHTGRPWLSVSTHMTSVAVHVCPCVSVSTHRTFVAVHQYTYQHAGPTTQHAGPSSGLFGTQRTSVGVRQHTQDVPVCPSAHTGRMWLFVRFCVCPCVSVSTHRTSVAVRVCLLAHTGRPWLSISTHISTLVLRLSTLALPVDCLGDFGPRGLSVQYTQDVCGCPSAHTGRPWVSISTHRTSVCVCQHTKDVCGCPSAHTGRPRVSVSTHRTYVAFRACLCVSVCVRQHTQDVRGCPSVHISARWSFDSARWPFRWTVWVILAHVGCLFSTHRTSVGVRQHTEDVSGCPSAHTERQWLSGCVCVCPSAHTGRLWLSVAVRQHPHGVRGCPCVSVCVRVCVSAHTGLPLLSISTHISTLVLGLSTLTLPLDCLGDFRPLGLSVQYTQDVRGCPSAHTGRQCVSVSTHTTSMAVRHADLPVDCSGDFGPHGVFVQYTQDHTQDVRSCPWLPVSTHRTSVAVRVCLWVSASTHMTSVAVHQYTYQHAGPLSQNAGPSRGLFGPWLSASTHRTSVCICQHTQDIRVCPCVSVSTHRTSVAVHQYTDQHAGLWTQHAGPSRGLFGTSVAVRVCLCVFVCFRQHTHDVCGCPSVNISACWSLDSARWPFPWTFLGYFGPRWLSVQYTQDVRGCPPAHTGRPWLSMAVRQHTHDVRGCPCVSVCVRQHTQDVCGCPSAHTGPHTGRPWLSNSTHITTMVLGLSTLALPVDCLVDFGPRGQSVQYTQDVRGCPPAHPRTSVAVRQRTQDVRGCTCVSVCVRQHTQDVRGCPSVHISARWSFDSARWPFPWTVWVILAHVGYLFSTHRTSVGVRQHTEDVSGCPSAHTGRQWLSGCVCVCPSAHTGRLWLSVSTHMTSVAVRVCPCVSVSTHRTSVAIHQYTYQHVGPWTQHADPSLGLTQRTSVGVRQHTLNVCGGPGVSVCVRQYTQDVRGSHTGRSWLSISTHISKLVLGLSTLTLPVDCLGDFGPRGLSFSTHRRRPWVSTSTHMTLVAVCQHTHDLGTQGVCGCPSVPYQARASFAYPALWPFPWNVWVILAHVGCPVRTHGTSCGGPSAQHAVSGVCGCPISTQGRSGCRVCLSANTVRLGCSVCVCVVRVCLWLSCLCCPCVSLSSKHLNVHGGRCVSVVSFVITHSAVCWLSISTHISTLVLRTFFSTLALSLWTVWVILAHRGRLFSKTQDGRGCPSEPTEDRQWPVRPIHTWTSVAVGCCLCVSLSNHTDAQTGLPLLVPSVHISARWSLGTPAPLTLPLGRLVIWPLGLSVSTHRTYCGLSVPHTGRQCVSRQHNTGRPWLFLCVRQDTIAYVAVHQYTYHNVVSLGLSPLTFPWLLGVILAHVGAGSVPVHTGTSVGVSSTHRTSVAVRSTPQDVSVAVRVRPSVAFPISYTYQQHWFLGTPHADPPVEVRVNLWSTWGCLSVHTGSPWVSTPTHSGRSVAVLCRQGSPWLSISTHISTRVLRLSTLALPVDCLGDFGPRGLSVQYTRDVLHTGRPWVSVSTQRTSVAVRQHTLDVSGCPAHTGLPLLSISTHISTLVLGLSTLTLPLDCLGDFGPLGLSVQYTQDVCGCPSAHTGRQCVSVSTHRTSMAVRVCPSGQNRRMWLSISTHIRTLFLGLSTLTFPWTARVILAHVGCLFSTHRTSVGVIQHTHNVCGCPSAHTGRQWLSVCVHPWLSISTHISTLVLGLSKLTLPVECSGDYGPLGLSVQYTQDVRGCPPPHTGRPWLSLAVRQQTHDVRGCPCVSACVCQQTQDVRGCPSVHISARGSFDSARWPFPWTVWVILALVGLHTGRPWVSVSTQRTSVAVRQHTLDVSGCPAHTGLPVAFHQYTYSTLVLGLSTLTLPLDCLGDFGPLGLSVQYTQDVCGCPSAHTGRQCVSVSTHRTSMAVRVCPSGQNRRMWLSISTHIRTLFLGLSTLTFPWTARVILAHVGCLFSTHRTSVGVIQHTHNVCGCPSAHTGRQWLSVCVHPWLSISTHISTLVLGLSKLTLPVECSGDYGPLGLSVQYTQDVRGCPPPHTGRPWLSLAVRQQTHDVRGCPCVSACVCQQTQDVRGCPSVHISARGSFDSARWPFPWTVWVILALVGCLFSTHGTSVGVRQHTQDVSGCLWLSVSTHRTSGASVCVCRTHRPLGCLCCCPSVYCGLWSPCVVCQTPIDSVAVPVCLCPCLFLAHPETSVAVHQYTYQHAGPSTQHAGPSRGLFG